MMILWINSGFLALIAQLKVYFRHLFEIKMQLKEVFVLKSQKNVYQIEEDDGKFIYFVNNINELVHIKLIWNIICAVLSCVRR